MSSSIVFGRSPARTTRCKYLQLASYDSAKDDPQNIVRLDANKPDGYVLKARALFKLKLFKKAEEVLLRAIKIARQNHFIRSDVEGMIKLKDELANSRVEILKSYNFDDAIDIAEMHWNDCNKPIIELIGFGSKSKGRANPSSHTPIEIDCEIINIIGPERAKQLYPEIELRKSKSGPDSSSYSIKRTLSCSNSNLSAEFAVRDNKNAKNSSQNDSLRDNPSNDFDIELRTALMLAEEKNQKYERKIESLEEELKKVYTHLLKINEEKKAYEGRAQQLESELNFIKNDSKTDSPRTRVFTNSKRAHNRSYDSGEPMPRSSQQFIARFDPGFNPYGNGNRNIHFQYQHNMY